MSETINVIETININETTNFIETININETINIIETININETIKSRLFLRTCTYHESAAHKKRSSLSLIGKMEHVNMKWNPYYYLCNQVPCKGCN